MHIHCKIGLLKYVQIAPNEVQLEKTIKTEIPIVKKPKVVHCDNKMQIGKIIKKNSL